MLKIVAKSIPVEPLSQTHESFLTILTYFMLFNFYIYTRATYMMQK